MKVPQYITTFRAIAVGITLVIMALLLLGDVVALLGTVLKGI
jgi:hypothetical protein